MRGVRGSVHAGPVSPDGVAWGGWGSRLAPGLGWEELEP